MPPAERNPRTDPRTGDAFWRPGNPPATRERLVIRVIRAMGRVKYVVFTHQGQGRGQKTSIKAWQRWAAQARIKARSEELERLHRYSLLRDQDVIYPGHPLVLAFVVAKIFDSFDEAFHTPADRDWMNCLSDVRIPGAAANVLAAVNVLHMLKDKQSWETVVGFSSDCWDVTDGQARGGHPPPESWEPQINGIPATPEEFFMDRCQRGHEQAELVKPLLLELRSWWGGAPA